MQETRIEVTRKHALNAMMRAVKVEIDGREVGRVRNDQTVAFPVAPGTRRVVAKIDWMSSNAVEVEVREGETGILSMEFCNPFLAFLSLFGFGRYLELESRGVR